MISNVISWANALHAGLCLGPKQRRSQKGDLAARCCVRQRLMLELSLAQAYVNPWLMSPFVGGSGVKISGGGGGQRKGVLESTWGSRWVEGSS